MAPAPLSVANFNTLCTKAEGRDKIARFFQYGARAIVGITGYLQPLAKVSITTDFPGIADLLEAERELCHPISTWQGRGLKAWNTVAKQVMTNLASARRAHRFCKEFPVIQSIPKTLSITDPFDRALELCQKISLAIFMVIDHVGYLKQVKVLPNKKKPAMATIQLGLKFFCLSNFVSFLIQAKKLKELASESEGKQAQITAAIKTAVKHVLLVVQTAHLSMLYQSHDALVGIFGIITSYMDIQTQWPEALKDVQKQSPDAKCAAKK